MHTDTQSITYNWNLASIPGDVHTDLWKAGVIDDPHYGRNSLKMKWVARNEWWYVKRFNIPEEMRGKVIRVVFEGVDYACDVWLNGTHLGRHEGMFSQFAFDITDVVSFLRSFDGGNMLVVKLDPPPKVYNKVAGRKFHWTGDYSSRLIPFGIWRPVKVVATEPVRIENTYVEPKIKDGGSAELNIQVELENHTDAPREVVVNAKVNGKNFRSKTYTASVTDKIKPGLQTVRMKLTVDDAKLWWPWDMGEQNLYRAEVTVEGKGGVNDRIETTFGIREVKMAMNPGFTKEEVEYPWTVMVNGKRHYLRSACWGGPPDIFYGGSTLEKYRKLVKLAKEANINNLRIFGWHPPEIPEFYELCNEAGITVWQNFSLSLGSFPCDDEYRNALHKEAIAIVKERRNHPSIVVWCGAEEIFYLPKHKTSCNKRIVEDLGEAIRPYTSVPYVLACPLSNPVAIEMGFKPKESVHALHHNYSRGQVTMEEYFPSIDCAFVPELTGSSAPSVESLKKFIPPDELWPPGPSWKHHWAEMEILSIINFEIFDDERMGSLEEFVNSTQIAHGTVCQFALEIFRRRKPRVSGVTLCHFNTYSPDFKWGIVDHYLEKKLCFDFIKAAYQPLLVSLQYPKRRLVNGQKLNGKIWVVNDHYEQYRNCTVELRITDRQKKLLKEDSFKIGDIGPDSSKKYADVKWSVPEGITGDFEVELSLLDDQGRSISANHYTFLISDGEKFDQRRAEMQRKIGPRRPKHK
jgi:beta-mannosidase